MTRPIQEYKARHIEEKARAKTRRTVKNGERHNEDSSDRQDDTSSEAALTPFDAGVYTSVGAAAEEEVQTGKDKN